MKQYVLIVDDEFGLADVVASLLVDRGYDCDVVINGKLALERLAQRRADVVITDLMMPIMDGLALIRAMRADPDLAMIPIVLMTALPEEIPPIERLFDHVLVKPFHFRELLAILENIATH